MSLIKRFVVIAVTVMLGISILGAIPVLAATPSITGVEISPAIAYTDSLLIATPQGWIDADGHPEGYQWLWKKYNTDESIWENIDGAVSNQLDLNSTLYIDSEEISVIKGDQIMVSCTPDDGIDEPGVSADATITISNSAPSITGVIIEPDPASTASLLVATPQGWADADGDDPGYQWQWQKYNTDLSLWENIDGANSDQLDLSSTLYIGVEEITVIIGDQFKVLCVPDDGTDDETGTGGSVEATITISILSYDAGIDVKPGSEENPINLKSRGVIPVAIYTTDGFDATTVVIETLKFGPNEVSPVHFAYENIDDDDDIDLILHFRTQDTGITEDDTEVTLTGETDSGTAFTGTDVIKIVPSRAEEEVQGNESAPGQNKEPGESADGKAKGKESAPGQNKEPGESADGKAKGKDK